MNKELLNIISTDFSTNDQKLVISELESILLSHVMAKSEWNLNNARLAILKLAKGNIEDVIEYTKAAKIDFRDVIMWAIQDDKSSK